MDISEKLAAKLISSAVSARENAYCPYSGFKVGAALLTEGGRIYTGCNFENASFGAGTCAERCALGSALSAGERRFAAIAVCGGSSGALKPCGICRQALLEFGDIEVICANADGSLTESYRLRQLLPEAFTEFAADSTDE